MQRCGRIIAIEAYANHRVHADDPGSRLSEPVRTRMLNAKSITAADYIAGEQQRRCEIAAFLAAFDRLDALVVPTIPFPSIPIAEVDENKTSMGAHTRFVNYLDLAGLSVPTRLSRAGLPMALQIIVRRFDDALALRIGRAFENVRGSFPAPRI
jgi:aspartyl-tRNA(Asn)/glutamyl-tRNA(Gln) amidotransferase subunit A